MRQIKDITEEDMHDLLLIVMTDPNHNDDDGFDPISKEDIDFELFHNDNSTMVDGDVVVGADFTCICFVGQLVFKDNGDIELFDEEENANIPVTVMGKLLNSITKKGYLLPSPDRS